MCSPQFVDSVGQCNRPVITGVCWVPLFVEEDCFTLFQLCRCLPGVPHAFYNCVEVLLHHHWCTFKQFIGHSIRPRCFVVGEVFENAAEGGV